MDDKKLETGIELRKKVRKLSDTLAYYEALKKETTGNTAIRIYMSQDKYALVHDGFANPEKHKTDGFNFLPFTPIQLLDLSILELNRRLEEAQAEYDAL